MTVDICMLTYRRDDGLTALLKSLTQLVDLAEDDIRLIVVDNYGGSEARKICERVDSIGVFLGGVHYVEETTRGISYARNRALMETRELAEYVAFLDDDEVVDPNWLLEMKRAIKTFGGDVWNGPVFSIYADDVPRWIIRGGFMDRKMLENGTHKMVANSGNVVFKRSILDSFDLWFDPDYALTGGEDTDFFERVALKNYIIIWARFAEASEAVTAGRANAKWLFTRQARIANQAIWRAFKLRTRWNAYKYVCRSSAVALFWFFVRFWGVFFFPWRKDLAFKPLLRIASLYGISSALFGKKRILEYI